MLRRNHGFSLIELSAVLVIMAVIAGSALSVAITQKESIKAYETGRKLDRVEEAIAGFLAINKRLPCPADGTLTLADAGFGLEQKTATSCNTAVLTINSGNLVYGMLPVKTLLLPDQFALDGMEHRIAYAVDMRFTNNDTTTDAFSNTNAGDITVQGNSAADLRTNQAVYVLISYGLNGYGAWPKNGGTRAADDRTDPPDADAGNDPDIDLGEKENHFMTGAFDAVFVSKPQTPSFDDEVRFKTKLTVLMDAGHSFSAPLCERARNIINGGSGCSGAANPDGCKRLAMEVAMTCL